MITSTLSTYPGKRVVRDLGIVFAYDDAYRAVRLAYNMEKYLVQVFYSLQPLYSIYQIIGMLHI